MRRSTGILAAMAVGTVIGLMSTIAAAQDAELAKAGKEVYDERCVICHGPKGDGMGLMGVIHRAQKNGIVVYTYPRDFTAGMFKFRSTSSGDLPTDEDLIRTVTNGIPRSGMPSHNDLSLEQRKAAVEYIKTFSGRWAEQEPRESIVTGKKPDYVATQASRDRGAKLFQEVGCFECHGKTGRGDGPSSPDLKDNWGDKILPFDFTSGALKGGTGAENIYRTFVTGLDGTPMPSYEDSLTEQNRWDIVSFCLELMEGREVGQK